MKLSHEKVSVISSPSEKSNLININALDFAFQSK